MGKIIVCGDFKAQDVSNINVCSELSDMLHNADCCICNFEAPIKIDAPSSIKNGPTLYQDAKAPEFLMDAGFNVILMANNHTMDFGEKGCKATINAFNKAICVGAGTAEEAFSVRTLDIEGKKVGFLSVVQHEFGVVDSRDYEGYGGAWVNSLDMVDIIQDAKQNVDYLMVFPHAGVEHTDAPLPEWRRLYRKFIDWGADAIIASHPHCPQGWEQYKGKYVFYSLGNFYWDTVKNYNHWCNSLAVEIEVGESLSIKTYNLVFDERHKIYLDKSQEAKQHIIYLNHLITDEQQYGSYINGVVRSAFEGLKYGILRGVCGVSLRLRPYWIMRLFGLMLIGNSDEPYLLNVMQNESHRWLLERYLRNKLNK